MLQRTPVIHGVTALALLISLPAMAQLPDAPSAVKARQEARHLTAMGAAAVTAADHMVMEREWVLGRIPSSPGDTRADIRQTAESGFSSSSVSRLPWVPQEMAAALAPVAAGQESLPRSSKPSLGPGRSSVTADLRPIPGTAPSLYSACPDDACAVAESVMCCGHLPSPFARYLKRPDVVPLTARDNLRSAVKGVIDPFNLLTIAGDSAIGVASDSHSPYGPGMQGFWKYAGVSLTEDMTGEFFGTFLVPSLAHQDPHYHREPFMPIKHRILHAIVQVAWAQSYTGKPMFNYANFVGGVATAAVSNTFVPGPGRQGVKNTSERLAVAFALAPTGNLIEEFVPDLASHINLRVVIFQRILNTVSLEESGVP